MKKSLKFISMVLAVMLLVCLSTVTAFAESVKQDGLNADIITDKETYSIGEDIRVTATLENTNDFAVKDVKIEGVLPDGLTLKEGQTTKDIGKLEAGEKASITFFAVKPIKKVVNAENTESNPVSVESGTDKAISKVASNPKTGDYTGIVVSVIALVACVGLTIYTVKKRKHIKIVSLVLCVAMVVSIFSGVSFFNARAEDTTKSFEAAETVEVDGTKYKPNVLVSYSTIQNSLNEYNIEITDFKADTFDILVGEKELVLFTANIITNITLAVKDVVLFDNSDNIIGYLNDNGENGDKIAKDGIFSLQTTLCQSGWGNIAYFVQAHNSKSNIFEICFYRNITEQEYKSVEELIKRVKEIENESPFSNEVISKEIHSYLETIGFVTKVDIDSLNRISIETSFGIIGVWEPSSTDTLGVNTENISITESQKLSALSKSRIDDLNYSIQIEKKDIVIICPYENSDNNFIINGYEEMANILSSRIGGKVTLIYNSDASLNFLKTLNKYGLVFFYSHGALSNCFNSAWSLWNSQPYTMTGEFANFGETFISSDFQSSRTIINLSDGRIGIGAKFYDKYYNEESLNNTLFHFGSCCSMKNNSIADSLISKGASWVQGYSDEVTFNNDFMHFWYTMSYLWDGKTINESVELALKDEEAQKYKQKDCELRYLGNNDFRIINYNTDNKFQGHTYQVINQSMTWTEAKEYCENQGGHLVAINSQSESEFISSLVRNSGTPKRNMWLGGYKYGDDWGWVTGEEFGFTNWDDGEPNNSLEIEGCIMLYTHLAEDRAFLWNDMPITGREDWPGGGLENFGFICEWDYLK